MNRFIKVLWSFISLTPLLFVLTIVFAADWCWGKTIAWSWILTIVTLSLLIILLIIYFLIIKRAIKRLDRKTFCIEEIESKDGTVASGMMTYLLPLVTITFNDINWFAFAGLIIVMMLLLIATRIVSLNPLLYLSGYKYYSIKAKSGAKYTLITKRKKFDNKDSKVMVEVFDDIYIELEEKDV